MEQNYLKIKNEIKFQQKALLDKLEFAYATKPEEWKLLRAAILKSFGGSGLIGFIDTLIEEVNSTKIK